MQQLLDFKRIFTSFDCRLWRDRDEECWDFPVGDFLVRIEPYATETFSGFTLGINCSISHKESSMLVSRIFGDAASEHQSIKWETRHTKVASLDEADSAFRQLLNEEVAAARAMKFEEIMKEFAASCPDRPSIRQLLHLAALAWKGDFDTLMDYEKVFERGHRLNFVPMITRDMIRRAVEIAVDRVASDQEGGSQTKQ